MNTELEVIQKIVNKVHKRITAFQKIDRRWTKTLRGACATSSCLIHQELKKLNINSWMIHATHKSTAFGDHVWVETPNYLIDITYSQFKEKENIVIINKNEAPLKKYYKNFFNIFPMDLNSMDIFKWPSSQDPIKCIERMKKVKL